MKKLILEKIKLQKIKNYIIEIMLHIFSELLIKIQVLLVFLDLKVFLEKHYLSGLPRGRDLFLGDGEPNFIN